MGQRIGLNYPGIESLARIIGIDLTADTMDGIQTMEATIISELAKNDRKAP